MSSQTVRLHRVFRAPPERLYKAFLDPDAMSKWLPPNGYTGNVQQLDAQVGGSYTMSFSSLAGGPPIGFGGRYVELLPNRTLRYTAVFDDPNLAGDMQTTVTLTPVASGTELEVTQQGIPAVIPLDGCYLGWQQSLVLLALLVETETTV